MLLYYNEQLTFEQFVQVVLKNNNQKGYIIICNEELYNEKIQLVDQSMKNIELLYKFQVVLLESWSEIYQFVKTIQGPTTIGIFGLFKRFIEDGMNDHYTFIKHHEFCGYELNKVFHKLFKLHIDHRVEVIVNDSVANNEKNEPIIWDFQIPNIRKELGKVDPFEISSKILFIKWFDLMK